MTEDDIRDLLREMGEEPVPADSLRRVRLRVAERTQPRLARWWRLAGVCAATAGLILLVLWQIAPPGTRRPVFPAVGRKHAASPPVAHIAPSHEEIRHPSARHLRPKGQGRLSAAAKPRPRIQEVTAPASATVIRIETQDPDVVILIIGD